MAGMYGFDLNTGRRVLKATRRVEGLLRPQQGRQERNPYGGVNAPHTSWVRVTGTEVEEDGYWAGVWLSEGVDADDWIEESEIWIEEANGGELAEGHNYLGRLKRYHPDDGLMVFVVDGSVGAEGPPGPSAGVGDFGSLEADPDWEPPVGVSTTCDIYRGANNPPSTPTIAAVSISLVACYHRSLVPGSASAPIGDRYDYIMTCADNVDIRDDYNVGTIGAADRIYIPDKDGVRYNVRFVLLRRGAGHKRVYLRRGAVPWPITTGI